MRVHKKSDTTSAEPPAIKRRDVLLGVSSAALAGWSPLQPWPPTTSRLSMHTTPPQNTARSSWRPKPAWESERCVSSIA